MKRRVARWGLSLLVLGCGDDGDAAYVNSGSLCLRSVDDGLQAEVQLTECLSRSCTDLRAGACSVSLDRGVLRVRSRIVVDRVGGAASDCSTECGRFTVQCELPPVLPDGSYTVVFGTEAASVTLPLVDDTPIVPGADHPCGPDG